MKKFIIVFFSLMVLCTQVFGGGSSKLGTDAQPNSIVSFADLPRILVFSYDRFSVTGDGQILVCTNQFKTSGAWPPTICNDANGRNAWVYAQTALPGFTLKAYEIRYISSGGYEKLHLYFK